VTVDTTESVKAKDKNGYPTDEPDQSVNRSRFDKPLHWTLLIVFMTMAIIVVYAI
jgi:hypothetical protein